MIALRPLLLGDAAWLAALHATAAPPGWSEIAYQAQLALPTTAGLALYAPDEPLGFILWQVAGMDVDLLMLAIACPHRRQGHGQSLLQAMHRVLAGRRVVLEVAADNLAAQALYARAGYRPVTRRADYYGPGQDALLLEYHPQ